MSSNHCPHCHTNHPAPKTALQISAELLHRLQPNTGEQIAAAQAVIDGLGSELEGNDWAVLRHTGPAMMELAPAQRGTRGVVLYLQRGTATIVIQRTTGSEKAVVVSLDYDPLTKSFRGNDECGPNASAILMNAISDLLTEDL